MIKSLKELSWEVTEQEYRADSGISYSTLSRFHREGWRNLSHLYDKLDTPSLTFGSAVDTLLTDGQEAFDEAFICGTFPQVSPSIIGVVTSIYKDVGEIYSTLKDVPKENILEAVNKAQYYPNYKETTRINKVLEEGSEYYNVLDYAGGRKILTLKDKTDVYNCVRVLKTSKVTAPYFCDEVEDDIENLYQPKFFATYMGIRVRCMFDKIIVDHKSKEICPIDLKTTGHPEEEFEESFCKWNYMIQAQLYTYILSEVIKNDEYFKDFKIMNYKFIVINRYTLSPIVWNYHHNFEESDSVDESGKIYPNWRKILLDLVWYLNRPNTIYSREAQENGGEMVINCLKPI